MYPACSLNMHGHNGIEFHTKDLNTSWIDNLSIQYKKSQTQKRTPDLRDSIVQPRSTPTGLKYEIYYEKENHTGITREPIISLPHHVYLISSHIFSKSTSHKTYERLYILFETLSPPII